MNIIVFLVALCDTEKKKSAHRKPRKPQQNKNKIVGKKSDSLASEKKISRNDTESKKMLFGRVKKKRVCKVNENNK